MANVTIQNSLKELYYSLGGNADNVRDVSDVNALILAIADLDLGAAINGATELPEAPEEDGTYFLQAVVDDGAATISWESDGGGGGGDDEPPT